MCQELLQSPDFYQVGMIFTPILQMKKLNTESLRLHKGSWVLDPGSLFPEYYKTSPSLDPNFLRLGDLLRSLRTLKNGRGARGGGKRISVIQNVKLSLTWFYQNKPLQTGHCRSHSSENISQHYRSHQFLILFVSSLVGRILKSPT
jgi:hypothetical protein